MIIKAQKQQTKSMNSSMVDFKSTVARRRRYSTAVVAAHIVVKSFLNRNAYFEVFINYSYLYTMNEWIMDLLLFMYIVSCRYEI